MKTNKVLFKLLKNPTSYKNPLFSLHSVRGYTMIYLGIHPFTLAFSCGDLDKAIASYEG